MSCDASSLTLFSSTFFTALATGFALVSTGLFGTIFLGTIFDSCFFSSSFGYGLRFDTFLTMLVLGVVLGASLPVNAFAEFEDSIKLPLYLRSLGFPACGFLSVSTKPFSAIISS